MSNQKNNYQYLTWGECISRLRTELGIPIITLCVDCNISTRTYYEMLLGLISKSVTTCVSWIICMTSS